MKTPSFFYLFALVMTKAPKSSFALSAPGDVQACKLTKLGTEYSGPLSVTISGRTCQRWDFDTPHSHNQKTSKRFPEGSAQAAENKCRNPDSTIEGPWCYTTDPKTRWEYCDVKFCGVVQACKLTKLGTEYSGPLSVTISGRTCQRWDSETPHSHNQKTSKLFPEGSAQAAGNKCRNPDSESGGPWCYTTDPNTRWEYCDVKFCGGSQECKVTKLGTEYSGPLSETISGRTCQRWDSVYPHYHKQKTSKLFPEGSAQAAGNKCRNPDSTIEGPWCYTTSPKKRWEYCDVEFCGTS